ncbi:MAG TPA: acyltransferase family protein [Paludibacteraceae bacterium]|nr:acyltransferase family protein [Paludibacteraceae bacterium]
MQRNFGLDLLRVIACYMVVQVHVGENYYIGAWDDVNQYSLVVNDLGGYLAGVCNSLLRISVPLFVMISGYFLFPMKGSLSDFFRKRLTRVLVPFVVWYVLYAFYGGYVFHLGFKTILTNILLLPVNFPMYFGHLWYVYMILGLYLLVPVLSPWLERAGKKELQIYLGIWVITLFLRYIHLLFPSVWGECYWNPSPMFHYFSGFIGYFLLGYYCKKYVGKLTLWQKWSTLLMITLGLAVTMSLFLYRLGIYKGVPEVELSWFFDTPNVAVMTLGVFLLFKDVSIKRENFVVRVVSDMGQKSYGIYLAHIMLLYSLFPLLDPLFPIYVRILIIGVAVFVATYFLMKILSYLPKSKYIWISG